MGDYAVGQSVTRLEDPRLLRGEGRFLDDIELVRQTAAYIVRSPHAHARVRGIDRAAARAAPGVLDVLTGEDYEADGIGPMPNDQQRKRRDGSSMFKPPRPALVREVAHVGAPVAMVVAETLARARDAAELLEIDYETMPVNVSTAAALDDGVPILWPDAGSNEAFIWQGGDAEAVEKAFAEAAHVVEHRFVINRISAMPMEPRGAIGDYDRGTDRFTLYAGLQRPFLFRRNIAGAFGIEERQLRMVAPDIGGSFGMRGAIYPEMILVLWAARRVGRPVKWVAERSEDFICDDHARDNVSDVALALDGHGKFLALRVRNLANLGGVISFRGAGPPAANLGGIAGVYTTPAIRAEVSAVLTNTHPTAPYRGAGRPEASYVIERIIDLAAAELGIDPAELRRRNTIPPNAMPYKTALTFTYDSGEFEKNLDRALEMADYAAFETRRADAAKRGKLRGIGVSNTIEQAASASTETVEIRFDPTGSVTLVSGSISHGQGHETTFLQLLSDRLGVDSDRVTYLQGDTDVLTFGTGTGGSRSATLAGTALVLAAGKIVEKGQRIAAHLLEAAAADIEFDRGTFRVAGTDKSVGIMEVAKAAYAAGRLPDDIEPGLFEVATHNARVGNFPNAAHVVEVEIDPDTGTVELVGYNVVDDVGVVINPLLVKGQILGGIAQGAGQALMEDMVYDPASGQLLSGSFMDYTMPRADDFCAIAIETNEVPTPTNPLGVKGCGESGTVGALASVSNAVINALAPLGIRHLDMPATPEKVWRAIREARH